MPESLIAESKWSISSSEKMMASSEPVFKAGDRVKHEIMGAGTIIEIDMNKAVYVIKFDILETPRNISFKVKLGAESFD